MANGKSPLYKIIAKQLEEKIADGKYSPGQAMQSEAEMQKEYNVSRVTVRQAYKLLIDKGILRTIPGKGTYVNDLEKNDWTWMRSFSQEVLSMGRFPSTRIVKFRTVEAEGKVAEFLEVPVGTPCFYFKRVRMIDNKPVWLTKSYVPVSLCPELSQDYFSVAGITQSIFKVLTLNFGLQFSVNEEITEAINIADKDAEILQIRTNKPVICSAMISYDSSKKPLLYENTIFEQSISKGKAWAED